MLSILHYFLARLKALSPLGETHRQERTTTFCEPLEQRQMLTTYVVSTFDDRVSDDGYVTLREAITAANTNMGFSGLPAGDADGDVIRFAPNLLGHLLAWDISDIEITDDLTIEGNPSAPNKVSAGSDRRFFIVDTAETVRIVGMDFRRGAAWGDNGGAILLERGELILDSVRMSNDDATRGGAVYCAGEGSLQILNSYFEDCNGLEGSVYAAPGATVEIRDTTFFNNEAKLGAAIYASEAELLIERCTFQENLASHGGVIYGRNPDLVRIVNCQFVENRALRQGGVIYLIGGRLSIQKSVFESNLAMETGSSVGDGGVLWLSQNSYATIGQSRFSRNVAHRNGGVVLANSGAVVGIHQSLFESNEARGQLEANGGGVVFTVQATVRWIDCAAVSNIATGPLSAGGAVSSIGGVFNSRGSNFRQNRAQTYGGAIAAFGGFLRVENSYFGGFTWNYKNLVGQGPIEGGYGGAIYVAHTDRFFVWGCEFRHNEALFQGFGGAIFVAEDAVVHFATAPSVLTDNVARQAGGAIFIAGGLVVEVPVTIARNTGGYGGGIYSTEEIEISPLIMFEDNVSTDYEFGP